MYLSQKFYNFEDHAKAADIKVPKLPFFVSAKRKDI